jgi:hypothetical protein
LHEFSVESLLEILSLFKDYWIIIYSWFLGEEEVYSSC